MKILLAHAIKEEKVDISFPGAETIYVETGVAKARAALRLMHAICEHHPDIVVNFGTAGTINHEVGDVVICNRFVDRDLRIVHSGDVISEIEFKDIDFLHFDKKKAIKGTCNTGDSFVTDANDLEGDCIDMESFAEADVCREMNIPFVAVKYITDVVGKNSVEVWQDKLADARKTLTEFFR